MPNQRMQMSKKNKWYIDGHRKYELVHFCKQYNKWKEALASVDGCSTAPSEADKVDHGGYIPDPTARAAAVRKFYKDRIEMVEKAAYEADSELWEYIIKGVTQDMTFDTMYMMYRIPCSRDTYYDRRAKFFWILDGMRG